MSPLRPRSTAASLFDWHSFRLTVTSSSLSPTTLLQRGAPLTRDWLPSVVFLLSLPPSNLFLRGALAAPFEASSPSVSPPDYLLSRYHTTSPITTRGSLGQSGGPGCSCPKTSPFINTHPPLFPTSPVLPVVSRGQHLGHQRRTSRPSVQSQILLAQHLSSVGTTSDPSSTRNCRPLPPVAVSGLSLPFSSPSAMPLRQYDHIPRPPLALVVCHLLFAAHRRRSASLSRVERREVRDGARPAR